MASSTYTFDPTGVSSANLITGEQHILTAVNTRDYHFIVPIFAPFFADSLIVKYQPSGGSTVTLTQNIDYFATLPFIGATRGCAKPIYGAISFNNLTLAGVIELQYQTLGGNWTLDASTLATVAANSVYNPRVTSWEQITQLPVTFPVINHEWDLVDMVGETEVVQALNSIESAILQKPTALLNSHLLDFNNPHRVTKSQVGLGNVQNYGVATVDDVNAGTATNLYVTPASMASLLNSVVNKTDFQNAIDSINSTDNNQNARLTSLESTLTGIQTSSGTQSQTLLNLNSTVQNLIVSNNNQDTEIAAIQAKQTQDETSISTINSEIASINTLDQTQNSRLDALENTGANQQALLNTLDQKYVSMITTNLGKTTASFMTMTKQSLSSLQNGTVIMVAPMTVYGTSTLPNMVADSDVFPSDLQTAYWYLIKVSNRDNNSGGGFYLARAYTPDASYHLYHGTQNDGTSPIVWSKLANFSDFNNVENLPVVSDYEIITQTSSHKYLTFDKFLNYSASFLNTKFAKTIDLTSCDSGWFYPVWWRGTDSDGDFGSPNKLTISRKHGWDVDNNPLGVTYPGTSNPVLAGSMSMTISVNGCFWGGLKERSIDNIFDPLLGMWYDNTTLPDQFKGVNSGFVRAPRTGIRCWYEYHNRVGYQKYSAFSDKQVINSNVMNGFYLRGGFTYLVTCSNPSLLANVKYIKTKVATPIFIDISTDDQKVVDSLNNSGQLSQYNIAAARNWLPSFLSTDTSNYWEYEEWVGAVRYDNLFLGKMYYTTGNNPVLTTDEINSFTENVNGSNRAQIVLTNNIVTGMTGTLPYSSF